MISVADRGIEERLNEFSSLKATIERIVGIAENRCGTLIKADDVEDQVAEELRQLGNEVIQGWAETRMEETAKLIESGTEKMTKDVKKS